MNAFALTTDESRDAPRGARLLAELVAPLRLPGRVVDALEHATEALQDLRPMREEVAHIREQSEPLSEILPSLERIKDDLATRLDSLHEVVVTMEGVEGHLDTAVDGLVRELAALHETVRGLQGDLERITDRLPDPDAPGPLGKAREALTGGGGA